LIIYGNLSFTTVQGQKIGFNSCECIKFLNIANIHALDVWGKRIFICNKKILAFFLFISFATQLSSTPVMSANLCNQASLFTELCLLVLQGTFNSTNLLFLSYLFWVT